MMNHEYTNYEYANHEYVHSLTQFKITYRRKDVIHRYRLSHHKLKNTGHIVHIALDILTE